MVIYHGKKWTYHLKQIQDCKLIVEFPFSKSLLWTARWYVWRFQRFICNAPMCFCCYRLTFCPLVSRGIFEQQRTHHLFLESDSSLEPISHHDGQGSERLEGFGWMILRESRWWFQAIWRILVNLDHFPRDWGENKQYFCDTWIVWVVCAHKPCPSIIIAGLKIHHLHGIQRKKSIFHCHVNLSECINIAYLYSFLCRGKSCIVNV